MGSVGVNVGVVVLPELVDCFGMGFGVGLIIRVDHVAGVTLRSAITSTRQCSCSREPGLQAVREELRRRAGESSEETNTVDAKAIEHGQEDCVVVLLELVGSVGTMHGVGLIVRVDHVARTAILGGEDIGRFGLVVENSFDSDQVSHKSMDDV